MKGGVEGGLSYLAGLAGGAALNSPNEKVRAVGVGLAAGAFVAPLVDYALRGSGKRGKGKEEGEVGSSKR